MPWTDTELAYLAGLIDGEGTVGVYCGFMEFGKRQKYGRPVYRMRIHIYNTNRGLLEWIEARFGGAILSKKPQNERCKPLFLWQVQGPGKCLPIIRAVKPYLVIKRQQAEVLERFPSHEVCNQWTVSKTASVRAAKHALYLETKRLNRKGAVHATLDGA